MEESNPPNRISRTPCRNPTDVPHHWFARLVQWETLRAELASGKSVNRRSRGFRLEIFCPTLTVTLLRAEPRFKRDAGKMCTCSTHMALATRLLKEDDYVTFKFVLDIIK
jgi:hypothetical protein